MPSVNFTVKWPNGEVNDFYSPSTIIHDFFKPGQQYSVSDFLETSDRALHAASERVRARYGYACSSAMDTLNRIQRKASVMKDDQSSMVEIVSVSNAD